MPLYEFRCNKCKKKFTVERPITTYDPKKVSCPKCKSRSVRRVITSVSVITAKKS